MKKSTIITTGVISLYGILIASCIYVMCTHTPSRKVARHKSTTTLVQKNKTESEPQKKESQNNVPNIDILDNLEKAAPIMLFAYQEAEQAREADELQTLQEVQAMYDALQPRNIGYAKTK